MDQSEKDLLFKQYVGSWLRGIRNQKGISQTQLASRIGLDRGHISNIERFQAKLSLHRYLQICFALEIDPKSLLESVQIKEVLK